MQVRCGLRRRLGKHCQNVTCTYTVAVIYEHSNNSSRCNRRHIDLDDFERPGGGYRITVLAIAGCQKKRDEPKQAPHELTSRNAGSDRLTHTSFD